MVDFRELVYFRNLLSNRLGVGIFDFQTDYDILMPCEFLIGFRKIRTHLKTYDSCQVLTFVSRRDNFISIKVINFFKFYLHFYKSNKYRLYFYFYLFYSWNWISIFIKMNEYFTIKKIQWISKGIYELEDLWLVFYRLPCFLVLLDEWLMGLSRDLWLGVNPCKSFTN